MDNSTQSTDEIQSSLERRLQNILENVEGVGEVKVMLMTEEQQGIYRSGETEVRGVLIAAEGASDPVVVQKIQQAVMALFQIEAHKIKIAVAGYLNFADVDLGFKDKEASTDSASILDQVDYDITDESALLEENSQSSLTDTEEDTTTPGEAVLTGASGFAAQAKLSREQVRSQNKADLQEIINNADISDDQKQTAINTMVEMTDVSEKEAAAEMLLEAKGFENAVVNLTGETADVVVPEADLEDAKRAQIEDIIKRKTGIAAENIVITPLDQTEDTGEESSSMEENADETAAYDSTDEADTTYEDQETSTDQVIQTDGIYD